MKRSFTHRKIPRVARINTSWESLHEVWASRAALSEPSLSAFFSLFLPSIWIHWATKKCLLFYKLMCREPTPICLFCPQWFLQSAYFSSQPTRKKVRQRLWSMLLVLQYNQAAGIPSPDKLILNNLSSHYLSLVNFLWRLFALKVLPCLKQTGGGGGQGTKFLKT